MPQFEAANVAVYALSYDEPDALRDFRDAHGITYTLLSDPNSEVIRQFGILNTLIDENDHPWFGIPYPGTYVLDAGGVITHKFFDNNLAVRVGSHQLLGAAQGKTIEVESASLEEQSDVAVRVHLEGESLTPTVLRHLVVHFSVPQGRHVYAMPAPEGTLGVDIALDESPLLVMRPIIRPVAEPHTLSGSQESFEVHHDQFELRLPLTVNSLPKGEQSNLTLTGEVCWQSCDDEVCELPSRQQFELTVPVTPSPELALSPKGSASEPNAMAHFQKMSERRVVT